MLWTTDPSLRQDLARLRVEALQADWRRPPTRLVAGVSRVVLRSRRPRVAAKDPCGACAAGPTLG